MKPEFAKIGAVVIGRNEGERLRVCLESVTKKAGRIVYVDSGSTDGSVELARSLGVEVVELDPSIPFTAARGRNAGVERLKNDDPSLEFAQFVEGDCEIVNGWFEAASRELESKEDVAVVCGRTRKRYPERTIYNRIIDMEWNTPIGVTNACGGDALVRASALEEVQGYNASLIAGEEPEMCLRLRIKGWKVLRIDQEMNVHDAQLHSFKQWWRRSVRCGHA